MNVKAEKIDQIIQIINRNLLLVHAGQENSVTPLEFRNLQRIDASVFGTDKFAFEMVHFVKSGNDNKPPEGSLLYKWEKCFVKGLETLLVECGVVKDDIERDCFVSRVYCWFSEKLSERRELPRPALDKNSMTNLKESVAALAPQGTESNTVKALDAFAEKVSLSPPPSSHGNRAKTADAAASPRGMLEDIHVPPSLRSNALPVIPNILNSGNNQRSAFANVLGRPHSQPSGTDGGSRRAQYEKQIQSLLPQIPGAESNYGMVHNKPESEGEIMMQEMWLARRRQEAFDWKAQQQVTLLMDRIGLHKSRVESETLRRQESGSYLSAAAHPAGGHSPSKHFGASSPINSPQKVNAGYSSSGGYTNTSASGIIATATLGGSPSMKFVPSISGNRPLSAKRQNAMAAREFVEEAPGFSTGQGMAGMRLNSPGSTMNNAESTTMGSKNPDDGIHDTRIGVSGTSIGIEGATVSKASRSSVEKVRSREYIPMRFNLDSNVTAKVQGYDRQHYYMQGSDSEEEEVKPERRTRSTAVGGPMKSTGGGMGGNTASRTAIMRAPPTVNRERPNSSKRLREVASNDPESKVHYRHTNYRRMPLTKDQTAWLNSMEEERAKKAEEHAKMLMEQAAAKKAKAKKKDGDKKDKKSGKKDKKEKKKETAVKPVEPVKIKNKYKSPAHFMAKNFPTFDIGDSCKWNAKPTQQQFNYTGGNMDGGAGSTGNAGINSTTLNSPIPNNNTYDLYNMNDIADENYGPMRTMQMVECNRILDVCAEWDVPIDRKVLHRALVIPQDKPEAITIEQGLHNPIASLMVNPLPKEHWKTIPAELLKGGKKKGGGKKKKKK